MPGLMYLREKVSFLLTLNRTIANLVFRRSSVFVLFLLLLFSSTESRSRLLELVSPDVST